jgi:hypothetical protein
MNMIYGYFKSRKILWLMLIISAVVMLGYFVISSQSANANSLYQPSLKRELSKEQRWQLDFEIANESTMREHNSRRFTVPGSFEKRALWFEETAQWYQIADLMRQVINFRTSTLMHDEAIFKQLFELGKSGDIGASCMAAMFYRPHQKEITDRWKLSYETVMREGLKHKDSGHPVCAGIESGLYRRGELGYEKNISKANAALLEQAKMGFYEAQVDMYILAHSTGELALDKRHFEAYLCWKNLAFLQAPIFEPECSTYEQGELYYGRTLENPARRIPIPSDLVPIAKSWCEKNKPPTTLATCLNLENQITKEK